MFSAPLAPLKTSYLFHGVGTYFTGVLRFSDLPRGEFIEAVYTSKLTSLFRRLLKLNWTTDAISLEVREITIRVNIMPLVPIPQSTTFDR